MAEVQQHLPFEDILAAATLMEKTVWICMAGTLRREYEDLMSAGTEDDVPAASETPDPDTRLATRGPKRKASDAPRAERLAELINEMRKYTYPYRLRALPSQEWNALCAKYPPRPGVKADEVSAINPQTFFPALVRASVVDPVLSAEDWQKVVAVLTDAQFDRLGAAAWQLNRRDEDVPFVPAS